MVSGNGNGNAAWTCVPLADAIKAENLDSHTYKIDLNENYSVGAVPNGGYVASCMLAAAKTHLASRGQPDTLTAHFEYPARTSPGPAIVVIEDVRLGRSQPSTLHLTLWQGGLRSQAPWITPSISKRAVLAYITHTDLLRVGGFSMETGWEVSTAAVMPKPLPDFRELKTRGGDGAWEESRLAADAGPALNSLRNWRFYLLRVDPRTPGILDMWVCAASGERIKQSALPYIVDSFPSNIHGYLAAPELRELFLVPPTPTTKSAEGGQVGGTSASLWLPTVVMNLEVKAALPGEGVEWLAVRVTSKQIKNGRFDLDVLVRDAEGEIVALSHHVALVLNAVQNAGKHGSIDKSLL